MKSGMNGSQEGKVMAAGGTEGQEYQLFLWNQRSILLFLPDERDHIQKEIRNTGSFYEREMLEDIALRVSPGEIAIDVGANIGNHTVFFAKCCDLQVYALEPMPHSFAILTHNIEINELLDRVIPLNIAAGQSPGKGEVENIDPDNLGMTEVRLKQNGRLDIKAIDSLAITGEVKVLKVDVEGMELDVLRGAKKTIGRHHPYIYVETKNSVTRYQVATYLAQLGYYGDNVFNHTPTTLFVPALSDRERFSAVVQSLERQRFAASQAWRASEKASPRWSAMEERLAQLQNQFADVAARQPGRNWLETKFTETADETGKLYRVLSKDVSELNAQNGSLHRELSARLHEMSEAARAGAQAHKAFRGEIDARLTALSDESSRGLSIHQDRHAHLTALLEASEARLSNRIEQRLDQLAEAVTAVPDLLDASEARLSARLEQSNDQLTEAVNDLAAILARAADEKSREVERLHDRILKLKSQLRQTSLSLFQRTRDLGQDDAKTAVGSAGRGADDRLGLSEGRLATGPIFESDTTASWDGWSPNQEAKLEASGWVRVMQETSTPGVRYDEISVRPGMLYEVRVQADFSQERSEPLVWVCDSADGRTLAPMVPARNGKLRFRADGATRSINLGLLVKHPRLNFSFQLRRAEIVELPSEADRVLARADAAVVASLASIPSRQESLRSVVASLLPQVDRLRVYLNGYDRAPYFLLDPKIDVRMSRDSDDLGDAGKFAWVDEEDEGYRLICDDDLIYPENYVRTMLEKLAVYDDRAVVGLHGVLLKQPTDNYHDQSERHVFHFSGALEHDRSVHVLGTNAVAYHSSAIRLNRRDFAYRNMADLWLTIQAQRQDVPLVAVSRPANWVSQNADVDTSESIWTHCAEEVKSSLNSALIQNAVIHQHGPFTVTPAHGGHADRKKLVFAVKTYNRKDYLEACIRTWLETRSLDHEWVVIIADDGSTDGTLDYLEALKLPHELHILRNQRSYAVGQTNSIFQLCRKLGFDVAFVADDDVLFAKPGWDELYLTAMREGGHQHLCYVHKTYWWALDARRNPGHAALPPVRDVSGTLEGLTDVERCMGAFFTVTPEILEKVGPADEANFPIRGQWHIDYSARCARGGFNQANPLWDAKDSDSFIELQNTVGGAEYRCALDWEEYKETKDEKEINRRLAIIHDASRVRLPWPDAAPGPRRASKAGVNAVFERVVVLNLDRRTDRWAAVKARCEAQNIAVIRHSACDGQSSPHIDEWRAYASKPLLILDGQSVRDVATTRDFYLDYDSEAARVAFLETRNQQHAIATPGAWGYLKSMISILRQALEDRVESLLLFDDDAVFHRRFAALFADGIGQLPEDWKILQLGALQYHWGEGWTERYSDNLYLCKGTSIGSHAVGMHASVFPLLLEHAERMSLPYDIGALHAAKRLYSEECFTFLPNVTIQDTSESDIESSRVQKLEGGKRRNIYRWKLDDYEFGVGSGRAAKGPLSPSLP